MSLLEVSYELYNMLLRRSLPYYLMRVTMGAVERIGAYEDWERSPRGDYRIGVVSKQMLGLKYTVCTCFGRVIGTLAAEVAQSLRH